MDSYTTETLGLEGSTADWAKNTLARMNSNRVTPEVLERKIEKIIAEKEAENHNK